MTFPHDPMEIMLRPHLETFFTYPERSTERVILIQSLYQQLSSLSFNCSQRSIRLWFYNHNRTKTNSYNNTKNMNHLVFQMMKEYCLKLMMR